MFDDKNPLKDDLEFIGAKLGPFWNELKDARIFITGGTGFFGCWLLESLLWANYKFDLNAKAMVLTRSPDSFLRRSPHLAQDPAIELFRGDVTNFQFPQDEFSHIIHAATEVRANQIKESPLGMLDTIIHGTRRVLDFAVHAHTKKVLLTSSGAVYGKQPLDLDRVPEDYLGAPDTMNIQNVYAEGKRTSELLCSAYAATYGLELKIARCFAFVGPNLPLDAHFAIGNFIRDGIQGKPIIVKGDGTPLRSYMYAADLTYWLWKILFDGKSLFPYNVGSDQAYSIKEVAREVAECFYNSTEVIIKERKKENSLPERYVPCIKRAKTDLGLGINFSLKSSINKTLVYLQETASEHNGFNHTSQANKIKITSACL